MFSARTDDTLTLSSGQQLDGFGMVTGIVATTSGSLLAPGNANTTGTLTVLGNVMLNGAIVMKLNPSGATNDALTVAGRLTYGGTLNVTIPSGTLVAGDSYQLFNAQSYAGSFSVTNLPTLTAGLTWTNTLGIDGTLSVVSIWATISSMAITNVSLSGTNLVFGGTNQGAGTYYVLASTNLTLPVTNWTAIATNVLSGERELHIDHHQCGGCQHPAGVLYLWLNPQQLTCSSVLTFKVRVASSPTWRIQV